MQNKNPDQSEVFSFLADPSSHGIAGPVTRLDTHAACVFLAGRDVYKVKRAVRYPFMDFSTLERRRRACENEIRVNKENAPEIYLGVVPIVRDDKNRLHFGGSGEIVEWAVHLRRFDERKTLDHVAREDALGPDLIRDLARIILEAHRRAPVGDGKLATSSLIQQAKDTFAELSRSSDTLSPCGLRDLEEKVLEILRVLQPLLLYRAERGQVRRCHGDLHLQNIALIEGRPVLFDAIEFDEAIATCDVLYDLAFLLMDLWQRGLRKEANQLLNRYFWACEDEELQLAGLATLPVFLSLRASVRAKVALELGRITPERNESAVANARRYFDAACDFLKEAPVHLFGIGGPSGSGKTTLAAHVACGIGRPPGAVHLRSDIERKRQFRVDETDRLGENAYTPEVTSAIYKRLRGLAEIALKAGQSVIVDAVHLHKPERDALCAVAARTGSSFVGLWLEGPVELLQKRVAARQLDASDATPGLVLRQMQEAARPNEWHRLDVSGSLGALAQNVEAIYMHGYEMHPSQILKSEE